MVHVITKSRRKTCDPYTSKYPRPSLDTRYSPMMEPIHAIPTFILSVAISVGTFAGATSLVKICHLLARMERNSKIFPLSVSKKPFSMVMVVITTEISTAMVIIAVFPVPAQIIITGPSAILGKLLSTTT